MGRRIGYARVSSDDQDLTIQKAALDRDHCAIVFEEKRSGTKRTGRVQLDLALKVLVGSVWPLCVGPTQSAGD